MLNIPHKNVQELGYINNKPLVFDNEPARHKLIDVIGDIADPRTCDRYPSGT